MPDGRLDAYLEELRARLRGLPASESSDIIEELRSHVRDSAGGGEEMSAVLARLGPPAELAQQYLTERLITRARQSRSPWLLLEAITRWAFLSAAGIGPLLALIAGYVLAGSFFLAAVLKPFGPGRVGLWLLADGAYSLRLNPATPPPAGASEILGWWIVPLGLLIGGGAYSLTLHFARFCLRHFKRSHS